MQNPVRSFLPILSSLLLASCPTPPTSDEVQRQQQEMILAEGTAQAGMPAIRNFRERKILKDILELRDQEGLVTYTYLWNEHNGRWVFFCHSVGYGIPYATQYTNPDKIERAFTNGSVVISQADPNGLFSPASAEGTWVLCKNPKGKETRPVYVEPRIIVTPFELEQEETQSSVPAASDPQ